MTIQNIVNKLNRFTEHREKSKAYVYGRLFSNRSLESDIKEMQSELVEQRGFIK